ncbi:MAG: hypothetical protein GEU94_14410 [Micromonosporaceae bacterium]|nr:hypothetical protein [Micromonosporaceae bacterium]
MLRRIALTVAAVTGGAALTFVASSPASACCVVPDHAIIVCQSASFYANYDPAARTPVGFKRTLYYGDKVGHTRGAHPVYNGWAATFDFGPNDWGYARYECLGGWGSW